MYLVDQARSDEVGSFLSHVPSEGLSITDFALHSIGVVLSRLNKPDTFLRLIQDAFVEGAVTLVRLDPEDFPPVDSVQEVFKLDFDDAYQYAAAEEHVPGLVESGGSRWVAL